MRFYSDLFPSEMLLVVSKLVWLVLKNISLFRNNNHARGFYRFRNSLILLKASTLANRWALMVFLSNSIYILGPLLLCVANECFRDGDLCDSMKGSVTKLIFKKHGDRKNFLVLRM